MTARSLSKETTYKCSKLGKGFSKPKVVRHRLPSGLDWFLKYTLRYFTTSVGNFISTVLHLVALISGIKLISLFFIKIN